MRRKLMLVAAVVLATVLALPAEARSSGGSRSSGRSSSSRSSSYRAPRTNSPKPRANRSVKCASCERDSNGRIKRSPAARRDFQRSNPCPSTGKSSGSCPGYVIDHVTPLKRGGADAPANMQWQTVQAAKAKDRIE
jgi:hypothetical protein